MLQLVTAVVLSYLAGSVPFSLWAGKALAGVDLRKTGSGNLGATNVFRALGAKVALPVLLLDTAKGFVAAMFISRLAGPGSISGENLELVCGGSAIVGHSFSIFVRFRGGKGVATSLGVFLAVLPWAVAAAFLAWVAVFLGTGYVSLGSCVAAVLFPVFVYLLSPGHTPAAAAGIAVALFIIAKHIPNLKRLARGEEKKLFGRKKNKGGVAS